MGILDHLIDEIGLLKSTAPFSRTIMLVGLLSLCGNAAAIETEKAFAKCQKMLGKSAAWILQKGDYAGLSHERKVAALISKHATRQAAGDEEVARMTTIIGRLVEIYEPQEYRRVLIDGAAEEILNVENDADFTCTSRVRVRHSVKRNFERYENRLDEIEAAVKERLDLEDIGPGEGLVVILFYARGYAQNVHINRVGGIGGDIHFGPVDDREYFRVIKVKAGKYKWHSIWNKDWFGKTALYLKRSNLDFTVEAGKLNYTGVFMFRNSWSKGWGANVRDRTAVVLSLLESRYPELLNKLEFTNGIYRDNRFIKFYLDEKKAAHAEDEDA